MPFVPDSRLSAEKNELLKDPSSSLEGNWHERGRAGACPALSRAFADAGLPLDGGDFIGRLGLLCATYGEGEADDRRWNWSCWSCLWGGSGPWR